MPFSYVNIVGEECKGWLNLFFNDFCVAMVDDVWIADKIREEISEKRESNKPLNVQKAVICGLCGNERDSNLRCPVHGDPF